MVDKNKVIYSKILEGLTLFGSITIPRWIPHRMQIWAVDLLCLLAIRTKTSFSSITFESDRSLEKIIFFSSK